MPGFGGNYGLMDMMNAAGMSGQGGVAFTPDFPGYSVPLGEMSPQLYSGGGGGGFGGGVRGGGTFNPPPELAGYFQAFGAPRIDDPRKVAAEGGVSVGQLVRGLLPRPGHYDIPSDKGGWFSIEDLYRSTGTPVPTSPRRGFGGTWLGGGSRGPEFTTGRVGSLNVPGIATHGQELPSTNNWRLLGMGPGWIMRNGSLINMLDPAVRFGGASGTVSSSKTAEHGMGGLQFSALGTGGAMGMPNRWGDTFYWPGAASGAVVDRYPAGTNV